MIFTSIEFRDSGGFAGGGGVANIIACDRKLLVPSDVTYVILMSEIFIVIFIHNIT